MRRLKEIKLLFEGYYCLTEMVSAVPKFLFSFSFLIYKNATLSETVGLEPWIQVLWADTNASVRGNR